MTEKKGEVSPRDNSIEKGNKADCVLIVSGGMDSITMLYEFKDR